MVAGCCTLSTQSEETQVAVWGLQQGVNAYLQHHQKPWPRHGGMPTAHSSCNMVCCCMSMLAWARALLSHLAS